VVTHRLQVERRTVKSAGEKTDILLLFHATICIVSGAWPFGHYSMAEVGLYEQVLCSEFCAWNICTACRLLASCMIVLLVLRACFFLALFSVFSRSECVGKCVYDCLVRLAPPSYDEVMHDSEAVNRPPVHEWVVILTRTHTHSHHLMAMLGLLRRHSLTAVAQCCKCLGDGLLVKRSWFDSRSGVAA